METLMHLTEFPIFFHSMTGITFLLLDYWLHTVPIQKEGDKASYAHSPFDFISADASILPILFPLIRVLWYHGVMTRDRFVESIKSQGWTYASDNGYAELWEREGAFFFLFPDKVCESLYGEGWSVRLEDIKTTRSRRHYHEIESSDNRVIVTLSEDDDAEIGCMG